MHTRRHTTSSRILSGSLVTTLVAAVLALVAGPATSVPSSGVQTLTCTSSTGPGFAAQATISADLRPGRTVAVGRSIGLVGLTARIEIPAAVVDDLRGRPAFGLLAAIGSFLQPTGNGGTGNGTVFSPSSGVSGTVPAAGPLVVRASLGDHYFTPDATGPVAIGTGVGVVNLSVFSPVSPATDLSCQLDRNNPGGLVDTVDVVAPVTQTVTFTSAAPGRALVGDTYAPRATASSGGPVGFSSDTPEVCTVSGSPATVTAIAAGQCTVRASQAGDDLTDPASTTQTYGVARRAQTTTFTTSPPDPARVSGTYRPTATATSGLPVTITTTTPATCTIDAGTVSFVAAGPCTVAADQAGDATFDPAPRTIQSFAITRAPQSPRFTSTPPDPARVGATYDVQVDGGTSGNPLTLTSTTPTTCTVGGTTATLVAAGPCTLSLSQAGSTAFEPGGPVTQTFTVTRVPTAVTVSTPAGGVSGEQLRMTATPSGTPSGTVQFTLDGVAVGAPVAYTGSPVTSPTFATTAGSHVLGATLTPTDTVRYAPSAATTPYVVGRAASATTVSVGASSITATVASVAPGSATPTGTVRFLLDGQLLGSAPLVATATGARATLERSVPPGAARSVTAVYDGDTELTGSSSSARRGDPTITATVSSNRPLTPAGWYSARTTVSWVCATDGAPLVTACPAPFSVLEDGITTVTRTISALDGGRATASTVVRLDQTDPRVRVRGVGAAPGRPRCTATDDTSGVRSCRLQRKVRDGQVIFRAVAFDRAGNKDVARRVVPRG